MEALLETERLKLRLPQPSDAEAIATQIGEWDVARMLARVPYPYTVGDAHDWIAKTMTAKSDATSKTFMVLRKGAVIGGVGFHDIRTIQDEKIAEIGYWYGKAHWHKGYATEAARALIAYAFTALGLAGLNSGHFKENHRSGRVLTKLGFRYAGEGKRYCLARDQELEHIDVVLTRAQWQDFIRESRAVA